MSFQRLSALVVAGVCSAVPAHAQSVQVQFNGGLVSVSAQNAPVQQILAEWARLGGTRFVNGERVPGGPVTLQLENVPERQALDVLLRSASGYMVAARQTAGSGASAFDRILIVPTSTPRPASPAPAFTPPQPQPQPQPQPIAQPTPIVEFNPVDPDDNPGNEVQQPEPGDGRPIPPGVRTPGFLPPNATGRPVPPQPFQPVQRFRQPEPDTDVEPENPPAAAPTNPFGVPPGASRPGTITPTPQPRERQPQPDPEP